MLKQDKVCGWCRKTDELVLMRQGGGVHTVCPECGSTGPYISTNEVGKAYRELRSRHNELAEAVAKMLITDDALYDAQQNGDASDEYEIRAKAYASARAEVYRLLTEEKP